MRPFQVVAPVGVLVPVEDLRKQVRVDTNEEDYLIQAYERAAIGYLDGYSGRLGRCILKQKWALPLVENVDTFCLPFPDCRDLAIERLDGETWTVVDGVTITQQDEYVMLTDLPDDLTGLHLTFFAGWETAADVPESLKQAVRMLVAHWFDNRVAVTTGRAANEVPLGVDAMITPLVHVFV